MVICTTKKKRLLLTISIVMAVVIACALLIYLKRITIYEDFSIRFQGLSTNDSELIQVYGISPTGKEKPLIHATKESIWSTEENSYHQSVILVMHDTVFAKIQTIIVSIGEQENPIIAQNLRIVKIITGNSKVYALPEHVKSNKSFLIKTKYIITANMPIILAFFRFLVLVLFVLLGAILLIMTKRKKLLEKTKLKLKTLSKKSTIKWFKISAISVMIALVIFYSYLFFALFVSSFVTSLLVILVSAAFVWFLAKMIYKIFNISAQISKKVNICILAFLFVWLTCETTLWLLNINKSYNEKITGYYSSGFIDDNKKDDENPHLKVYHKHHSLTYTSGNEFSYKTSTNADGLRDIDRPLKKDTNEYRIICLGNSYTEGIGAPQDSTWPKLLEDKLKSVTSKKVSVFNAGVSGSDPFFQYMLLDERMLKYQPDLVLVALGSTDFNFYRFRGGFERFTKDGYHYRESPWWERLYAISYMYRFYLNNIRHYKIKFLQSPEEYKKDSISANHAIENCVQRFYQLSKQKGFLLAIVLIDEWRYDRYDFLKNKLISAKTIPVIDLVDYNTRVEKLTDEDYFNYYWPIDKHCNPKGYELYAKGVLWHLEKMGILDSIQTK